MFIVLIDRTIIIYFAAKFCPTFALRILQISPSILWTSLIFHSLSLSLLYKSIRVCFKKK